MLLRSLSESKESKKSFSSTSTVIPSRDYSSLSSFNHIEATDWEGDYGYRIHEINQFSDDEILTFDYEGSVKLWNIKELSHVATLDRIDGASHASCTLKILGDINIVSTDDGELRIRNMSTKEEHIIKDSVFNYSNPMIELNNGCIAMGSKTGSLQVWDLKSNKCINELKGSGSQICRITRLSNGLIVTGSKNGIIQIWDLEASKINCYKTLEGHTLSINSIIEYSPSKFITASSDKTLRAWDSKSGECLKNYNGHEEIIGFAIKLSNTHFVSGSADGVLKFWDFNGPCLKTIKPKSGFICDMRRLSDKYFATLHDHSTLHIWNSKTGECVQTFGGSNITDTHHGMNSQIWSFTETRDGNILTGTLNGSIGIWTFPLAKPKLYPELASLTNKDLQNLYNKAEHCYQTGENDKAIKLFENLYDCLKKMENSNFERDTYELKSADIYLNVLYGLSLSLIKDNTLNSLTEACNHLENAIDYYQFLNYDPSVNPSSDTIYHQLLNQCKKSIEKIQEKEQKKEKSEEKQIIHKDVQSDLGLFRQPKKKSQDVNNKKNSPCDIIKQKCVIL